MGLSVWKSWGSDCVWLLVQTLIPMPVAPLCYFAILLDAARARHPCFVKSLKYEHYRARLINRLGAVTPSAD
jgi:hypothetical protein